MRSAAAALCVLAGCAGDTRSNGPGEAARVLLESSAENCGDRCGPDQICSSGQCVCVDAARAACGDACMYLSSDVWLRTPVLSPRIDGRSWRPRCRVDVRLDKTGVSVCGRPAAPPEVGALLDQTCTQWPPIEGAARFRVARDAPVRSLVALIGAVGSRIQLVEIETESGASPAERPVVTLYPDGWVPEHLARCGVGVVFAADGQGTLRIMSRQQPLGLPAPEYGPEVSRVVQDTFSSMKGCESTLWMFTGEPGATWGPSFDVSTLVAKFGATQEVPYFMMVLDKL